jgi:hypothetical protein
MQFNFGNKKSIKKVIINTLLFSGIIALVSQCTGIDEKDLTDLVDEINREWVKNDTVNEQIITNPELLERRIERDVDKAIETYQQQVVEPPKMTDKQILKEAEKFNPIQQQIIKEAIYYELPKDGSRAQELLGPPMGIRLDAN